MSARLGYVLLNSNGAIASPAMAAPGSLVEGDAWDDSVQKTMSVFISGIRNNMVGSIYSTTGDVTVANTVTETDLIDGSNFVGTKTIPANFFTAGKSFRIKARGFQSTTGTPTIRFRVRIGGLSGTIVADSGAQTILKNLVNGGFSVEAEITCRSVGSSGTVIGQGSCSVSADAASSAIFALVATSVSTIDTTASQALFLTVEWGTAASGNTITNTNCFIEVIN